MVSPPDRSIIFELVVRSGHPALLEGLDVWLRLELLSDESVRQLCAEHLSCLLSEAPARSRDDDFVVANNFGSEEVRVPVGAGSMVERPPSPIARGIQSFMAEVSVIWLLFLGVFMVVVSSGVLAATQWRNFSAVGQYGILFAYTLAFWAASVWTGRQQSLRLTARMLQIATLLIIPVNFWMMDGFRLWQSGLGWFMAAIAAIVLTGITVQLLKPEVGSREPGVQVIGSTSAVGANDLRGSRELLPLGAAIALSWLHWGWGWTGFPLVATYVGTIGATIALVYEDREWGVGSRESGVGNQEARGAGEAEGVGEAGEAVQNSELITHNFELHPSPPLLSPPSLSTITIAIATLLLIARAVLAAGVPIDRLGLAVGICGWLLCWLGRRDASRISWQQGGTGLLLTGWLIAVTVTPPWQAIAISGLSLWLLADYLRRSGQVQYLTAGWLVGLQTVWLLWRAIPSAWQQRLIETSIKLAGREAMPVALLGLWFFPYLLLSVWIAGRLRRWHKLELAKHAEFLALVLGFVLAAVSFGNGWTRSLNLVLSTSTLIAVLRQRTRPEAALIYLTHGTGLAAIASLINLWFPSLAQNTWAAVLLVGTIAEWLLSAILPLPSAPRHIPPYTQPPTPNTPSPSLPVQTWQQSAWHAGLILAATSYLLLSNSLLPEWTIWGLLSRTVRDETTWGSMWLVVPTALTVLGSRRSLPQSRSASDLSVISLFLVQVLMFDSAPARLTGLGTAVVLMFINTHQLRQSITAVVTVGFGLAFAADAVWEIFTDSLTVGLSINLLAIALLLLWLLWGWLNRRETSLADLYRQASDGWAIAVTVLTLTALTLCQLVVYVGLDSQNWQYLSAAVILFIATGYRTWQRPQNTGFYAIAWSLELVITGIVSLTGQSLDAVAIANLALGLGMQLLGDWWIVKRGVGSGLRRERSAEREWGVGNQAIERNTLAAERPHPSSHRRAEASYILYPSSFILSSWHLIPLLYALVGLFLQHRSFTATTGLYTLAAALVGIGVGRRQPFKPLVYLSVLGASIAVYELLIYQLSQARGETGDGLTLLAGLAAAIAIIVCLLQRWLAPYLRLAAREIAAIAHLHWGLGSALMPLVLVSSLSSSGEWLWTCIAVTLTAYALARGNERWQGGEATGARASMGAGEVEETVPVLASRSLRSIWTYTGIVEAIVTIAHLLHQLLPEAMLLTWGSTIAAGLAFMLYRLPWRRWGWQRKPWERSAAIFPIMAAVLTINSIAIQGLLIVAAFYAWLAKAERQVRLSYLSVLLADWAVVRWLDALGTTEPLWYAALFSASLLYLAQVDPGLRSSSDRETRHLLRSLATGLVCLTAFYQAEVGIAGAPAFLPGLLSLGLQLGFIVAGLLLRIRAFLFVGTVIFMLQVLRQIWRFIDNYSLLLWAMGIALGLIFIWVAATFEARRSQISALMQYWVTELDTWE